jgi:galactoside O-acetyltransferase
MGTLSREEVARMGFASVGDNVMLSDRASFYNCSRIAFGDHVRVDDFAVLSAGKGGIHIGSYVHIAVGSTLIGGGKITLSDFSGLSSRVSIYSSSDDYSGAALTNPTVSPEFTRVHHADVTLEKHVIVGSGSVILPGMVLEEGVAIGALSMVSKSCSAFGVYHGNPVRRVAERKRDLLELEKQFLAKPLR